MADTSVSALLSGSLLNTQEAAAFMTKHGRKTTAKTLERKRCKGGGPIFIKIGPNVRYAPERLLEYIKADLSEFSSTSEWKVRRLSYECSASGPSPAE